MNYYANTSKTTLSEKSSTLASGTNEIYEFINSFETDYTVEIPTIYNIFKHADDFAIYNVGGYLPAKCAYYKGQPQYHNYNIYTISPFYCVQYNSQFNQSFGGLGDVGIVYNIEGLSNITSDLFGNKTYIPLNYTYGGINPY